MDYFMLCYVQWIHWLSTLNKFFCGCFTVRIGLLYVISGFGGSLLSSLFIQSNISVGASGALFGLLGGMLSELITNWTIYSNKVIFKLYLSLNFQMNNLDTDFGCIFWSLCPFR